MVRHKWFEVPAGDIKLGRQIHAVARFEITFTPITLRQYRSFLEDTQYTPVLDRKKRHAGYFLHFFEINFGNDPSWALYGVTHDDAVAYCEWAQVRLPTSVELARFFDFAVRSGSTFVYAGPCWTSDAVDANHFITRNGPYQPSDLKYSEKRFRESRHRHSCELDECMRVVRTKA